MHTENIKNLKIWSFISIYTFKNPKTQILKNYVIKEKRETNMLGESSYIYRTYFVCTYVDYNCE